MNESEQILLVKKVLKTVGVVLLLIIVLAQIKMVDAGERRVVTRFGEVTGSWNQG